MQRKRKVLGRLGSQHQARHTVKDAEAAVMDRLHSLGKTHLLLISARTISTMSAP
jgi:hypothetical protein